MSGVARSGVETYQCLHGAVKSMLVVAAELGVSTLERRVSVGLRLVNAVCAIALASVVQYLMRSSHSSLSGGRSIISGIRSRRVVVGGVLRTRSCEPSCSGCAASCSSTLRKVSTPSAISAPDCYTYWPLRRFARVKGL